MLVCHCHGISAEDIRQAMDDGCRDLESLARTLGIATCCGGCREHSEAVIEYFSAVETTAAA